MGLGDWETEGVVNRETGTEETWGLGDGETWGSGPLKIVALGTEKMGQEGTFSVCYPVFSTTMIIFRESSRLAATDIVAPGEAERNPG